MQQVFLKATALAPEPTPWQCRLEGSHKTGTRLPASSKYSKHISGSFSAHERLFYMPAGMAATTAAAGWGVS